MDVIIFSIFIAIVLILALTGYSRHVKNYRERMIRTYTFPAGIKTKVSQVYPHLSDEDLQVVMRGLREYFHIINLAGKNIKECRC